jgi:hypothetical protein
LENHWSRIGELLKPHWRTIGESLFSVVQRPVKQQDKKRLFHFLLFLSFFIVSIICSHNVI